jgi:hypothetical protein
MYNINVNDISSLQKAQIDCFLKLRIENLRSFESLHIDDTMKKIALLITFQKSSEAWVSGVWDLLQKFLTQSKLTTFNIPPIENETIYFSHGVFREKPTYYNKRQISEIAIHTNKFSRQKLIILAQNWASSNVRLRVKEYFQAKKQLTAKASEYKKNIEKICDIMDFVKENLSDKVHNDTNVLTINMDDSKNNQSFNQILLLDYLNVEHLKGIQHFNLPMIEYRLLMGQRKIDLSGHKIYSNFYFDKKYNNLVFSLSLKSSNYYRKDFTLMNLIYDLDDKCFLNEASPQTIQSAGISELADCQYFNTKDYSSNMVFFNEVFERLKENVSKYHLDATDPYKIKQTNIKNEIFIKGFHETCESVQEYLLLQKGII